MNSYRSKYGRLLVILLLLMIPVSCGQDPLPEAPAFETLGFADALEPVHRQMLTAYELWQQNPRDAELNGRLGMMLATYAKYSVSEVFFQRARMLAPEDFRWTYHLAIAVLETGRLDEAAELYREALAIDPDYVWARIRLADLLLKLNDIEGCIVLYRQITDELPDRVNGWLGLAKAYLRSGDLEAADTALLRARAVGHKFGEVHFVYAALLRAQGDEPGAARALAVYKRTANNPIRTPDPLVQKVVQLNASDGPHMINADYHLRRSQFGRAAVQYRNAVIINPANQDAWGGLVESLAKHGEADASDDAYRTALAVGISYRRLHLTYAQALRERQQPDAAREVISKAIELDPQYVEALTAMAELEMQRGENTAAVEYYRRALSARPNDRPVMLALAQALNASGQFDEAAGRLEPLTSDPAVDKALVFKELAIAYHGLTRRADALNALQRGREAAALNYDSALVDTIDTLLARWQNEGS